MMAQVEGAYGGGDWGSVSYVSELCRVLGQLRAFKEVRYGVLLFAKDEH